MDKDFLDNHPALQVIRETVEDNADEENEEVQIFPEHDILDERFGKSLYYGRDTPSCDRLSLPVTELCVDYFNLAGFDTSLTGQSDLDITKTRLDRLDVARAAAVSRETCASPTSLVLALVYLERLRGSNPTYLHSVSSADLFLVSLLVASKLLHDDGEEDEVFNEEWANSAGMEKKDLNRLEIEFLSNIDWNCYVSPKQFEKMTDRLEKSVIQRQINGRKDGWTTYTDINVLSKQIHLQIIWERLANVAFQVTAVCLAAYAASLVTMIGTCHALTKANLGPSAVSQSFNTLKSAVTSSASSSSSTLMMMSSSSPGPDSQNSSVSSNESRIPQNLSSLDASTLENLSAAADSDGSSFTTLLADSDLENHVNRDSSRNAQQEHSSQRTLYLLLDIKQNEIRWCHQKRKKPPYILMDGGDYSKAENKSDSMLNIFPVTFPSSNRTFMKPDRFGYDDIDDNKASTNVITKEIENLDLDSRIPGSVFRDLLPSPLMENAIDSSAVLSSSFASSDPHIAPTQFSSFCCSTEKSSCENNWNNMFHDPPHDLLSFFNPCHKKENVIPGSLLHDYQQRQQRNALFNQIHRRTVIGF